MSIKLLKKLEQYEQDAYDAGFGQDWLEDVGEGFKFYVRDCVNSGCHATLVGFERYLDKLHRDAHNANG